MKGVLSVRVQDVVISLSYLSYKDTHFRKSSGNIFTALKQ